MTTADRMAVLDKGVLQQVGPATGLFDFPSNRFVAGFVGTANLLEGQVTAVENGALHFDAAGIGAMRIPYVGEAPSAGAAAMAFRPHQVHIRATGAAGFAGDASRVWLDGIVESTEFLGEVSRYRMRVGTVSMVADEVHYAGEPVLQPGVAVRLGIDPKQVRFLSH